MRLTGCRIMSVGTKPDLTWTSPDGSIIYIGVGEEAYYTQVLVDHLGLNKCLPSMISYYGAMACNCPDKHGRTWSNGWHFKPAAARLAAAKAACSDAE